MEDYRKRTTATTILTMKVSLNKITKELQDAILNYIEKEGISKRQFAIRAGVHPLQLNAFLRDEAGINIKTAEKLADVLES